jgi:hypothetical protein
MMEKIKKWFRPPFYRNISQTYHQAKSTQNDPKMTYLFGKRPRQHHIKCWGCEGDHLYTDLPHKGENIRIVQNIQEFDIVEDIGRSMPRIYASLDNKKLEYQYPMIKVEGNIHNQPIAILIDSGASHSYINPNLFEIFHLQRSKHEKSWLVQLST